MGKSVVVERGQFVTYVVSSRTSRLQWCGFEKLFRNIWWMF